MTGYATEEMIPGLKEIWNRCFGDDRAYTDFIFANLLRADQMLVYTDGENRPMAMLCLEPFSLETPVGSERGAYIYGVATHPEYQGRGLSSTLLRECGGILAGEDFALSALVPASGSLFDFYGKRGYETAFYIKKAEITPRKIPASAVNCVLAPAALESLEELRDETYRDRSAYVRWDERYLAYIGDECRSLGGEVLRISCGEGQGYAVCYPWENSVIVKELAIPEFLYGDVLSALHTRYRAGRYQLYLPPDWPENTNKVLPFAMVQWYDKEKRDRLRVPAGKAAWIAHVLD